LQYNSHEQVEVLKINITDSRLDDLVCSCWALLSPFIFAGAAPAWLVAAATRSTSMLANLLIQDKKHPELRTCFKIGVG
jgi:hypothetical protein